ncbi:MAG: hypothetical protein WC703_08745, partial [Candidatus Neomarinimicrobiota bacterium]
DPGIFAFQKSDSQIHVGHDDDRRVRPNRFHLITTSTCSLIVVILTVKERKDVANFSKRLVFNTLTGLIYQQNRHRLKIFFVPTEETLDI